VTSYPKGNLFIPGPAGTLECIARTAEGASRWAVVSHPHPQHGGTLHNKIVYRTGRALEGFGFNVLRYNYRGVGHSTGEYGGGRGEADDLRAVLDYLERTYSQRSIFLAGFSFGAWMSARVGCLDPRGSHLLLVGLAASLFEIEELSGCRKPCAMVQGDRDQYGEWSKVEAAAASMGRARLFRVEGADHFFEGKIPQLEAALRDATRYLLAEPSGAAPGEPSPKGGE
jgi:alpha/beta superfamily hydrolase